MWNISKGVLWLLDGFFEIIDSIWRYKFFENEYVDKIFGGAIIVAATWLILKVVIELIMNHIIKNEGKGNPLTIYRGVVLAIVIMFLITPLFDFGHKVSTELTDVVITVSGMNGDQNKSEGTISKALIRAMIYEDEMDSDDIDTLVKDWKKISITESEGGALGIGDVYVYSLNFFMLIILSVVTIFLLFFVAIQMAKRVMEIALYKILGPFCATSLTSDGSKAFETWCKSTKGLFLITVVQFVSLGLLLNMFGSAIKDNGTMAGIFLIIGALLFIISTPTIVSSLLGQQSGLMTAFGDMQSLMALGQGVSAGMSLAKSGVTSSLSKASNVISKLSGKSSGSLGIESNNSNGFNLSNSFKNNDKLQEAVKMKSNNGPFGLDSSNPYKNPHSIKFNPIRNQYKTGNEDNANGRWY